MERRTDQEKLSPWVAALREEVAGGGMRRLETLPFAATEAEIQAGHDSLWVFVRRPGAGGFALRTACAPGGSLRLDGVDADGSAVTLSASGAPGVFRVRVEAPAPGQDVLRVTTRLTPTVTLNVPFWPRDLYALGAADDPSSAAGRVWATQHGLSAGLAYLTWAAPQFGGLLYFQDFSALNDYGLATGTAPRERVGGQWPELGYAPAPSESGALPAGQEFVLSDAFLHWTDGTPQDEHEAAEQFLDLLAGLYRLLDRPPTEYHDWPGRAEATLRDLEQSPDATMTEQGDCYLRAYTGDVFPDSMVQLAVLLPLRAYANWAGRALPLTDRLRAAFPRFFDDDLGVVRRYLPGVGGDKDPDEVDSWYLYHPMMNLGRLALQGDAEARDLFLRSLEYGIKAARHFHYRWPVFYDMRTLETIQKDRAENQPGQSDTGGLYAYVMLQAWELTGKDRYLREAEAGARALEGYGFDLVYQANLTAWGAAACLRLWKITSDENFRGQGLMLLAGFFHNTLLWQSKLGAARHFPIFLGASCLFNAPYMALYECFESYVAFRECLTWADDDLPAPARLLITEYCKYTPSRAWYYYPSELPEDALATENIHGHIDRTLAFPLEDLYADGQPAGQYGQEIYGCGAAFAFAACGYHRLRNAPALLFCEYPLFDLDEGEIGQTAFRVRGLPEFTCRVRLLSIGKELLPDVHGRDETGRKIKAAATPEGHWELTVPGGRRIVIYWG